MNPSSVAGVLVVLLIFAFVSMLAFLESDATNEDHPVVQTKQTVVVVGQHSVSAAHQSSSSNALFDFSKSPPVFSSMSDPNNVVTTIALNNLGLRDLASDFFTGKTCRRMWGNDTSLEEYQTHSSVARISFGCMDLFTKGEHGTGNFITAFYGVRMAAHAMGHTDVDIQCHDAEETKSSLILPWMMGLFPRLPPGDPDIAEQPSVEEACRDYKTVPIGYRWKDMLFELRRMAIAMVGIPSPDHPSAAWAEKNLWADPSATHTHGRDYMQLPHPKKGETPLFPDTQIDDAVLHFRCGDIINSNHPSFGFMKFGSFSRHISPEARRIGVVTQPFDTGAQQRKAEGGEGKRKRCKLVVYAFLDHLEERFPNAEITLHNSIDETIALTFARLIMANQTVIGITSFGVFPGVSTFGTGYIREPDYSKAPNRWLLTSPILKKVDHVRLIQEPKLMASQVRKTWGADGTAVLEWFRNYDDVPGAANGDPPRPRDENHKLLTPIAKPPVESPVAAAPAAPAAPPQEVPVESETVPTEMAPVIGGKDSITPESGKGIEDEQPPIFAALSDPDNVVNVIAVNNTGLRDLASDFFKGRTCRRMWKNDTSLEEYQTHSSVVKITFGCMDLFKRGEHGTGNFITAFYGVRMAAHAMGHTDVDIQCYDAEETKSSLILPWMMGLFPRLPPGDPDIAEQPPIDEACASYNTVPIGYRWKDMLFELRRMAIAMVGIPWPDHPSAAWAEKNLWADLSATHTHGRDYMQLPHPKKDEKPFYPDTQIDDAVLHFRCGDIINSNHPSFGFMKFGSFSRHISPEARRIGVVTQPFDISAHERKGDAGREKKKRCKLVVYAFLDHLEERFPNAEVSLHNSIDETIALTFARLIMANQTVIGITSFGVFPGVSTFGTGYIRNPDYAKAPNRWLLTSPILKKVDHIKLIDEPRLMAGQVKRGWGENGTTILKWFRNYDDNLEEANGDPPRPRDENHKLVTPLTPH